MKKKLLLIVLCMALTVIAFGFAGCQKAEAPSNSPAASDNPSDDTPDAAPEKTQISFMGWGNDSEVATFQAMIDQYEAKYENVEVDYIVVPSTDFDTKLQTMIGSGEQPDAFYCGVDNLMKYASTGNLYDMTGYIADNDIFDQGNVWDCAINLYRYDGDNMQQGPVYAVPKDVSVFPIVYNKDLFAAANVTPPTKDDPWDWNDYAEAAKKLTTGEGDSKIYGSGAYSLESAVWSNGADWLDSSLTKVTVDDPKFVEALQWAADLRLVEGVVPTVAESDSLSDYDRFKQGKLAMVGSGTWSFADFWDNCDFDWDVMNWPVSPNTGKTAIWFGSAGLAVSSMTEHPEEACNLVSFLAFNEDAQRTSYQTGMSFPLLKDMAQGEYMQMDKAPVSKDVMFDILNNNARLATQSKTFNQDWFAEFNANVPSVFSGETTAQEFCASIKDTLQDLLDQSIEQKAEYSSN